MSSTRRERLEEMFLELVDLPMDQRASHLDDLCRDDASLRIELSELLAADQSHSGDEHDGVIGGFVTDPMPHRVGQYRVSGIAGEGGMGAVYDAIHEPTRRRAAVKLLHVATSTTHGRSRMRVEAETLGRLDSANIARLYDAGVAEIVYADGRRSQHPFIAMEFVEGRSIVDFARENKLTDLQRLALMQTVAEAVHHAHQRGVMHRDLKPRNVLVLADGTPKVVDFGIARLIDAAGDSVTQTGQLLGTLRYMSPEQTAGDHRNVDTRTDVYALGAILYELLSDRPLMQVDTGASLMSAMKVLQTTPERLAKVRPELAGDVEAIVHKAVAFEAGDRYSSAQALADDLRLYLEGRDVTARAPTALERATRFVRRNKGKVAVATTILLLLSGGIVGTSWGLFRAERARRAEAEQRQMADKSAAAAKGAEASSRAFSGFLVKRILATARPADIQGGLGVDARVIDAIESAEEHLESDFRGHPAAEAIARQAIGATWRNRGELAKARAHLQHAETLALQSLGSDNEVTLDIQNSLILLLSQMGQRDQSIQLQEKVVAGLEATVGRSHVRTFAARHNLAIYHAKTGNFAMALRMLEQVHADRAATLGAEHAQTLVTISDIAELNLLLGNKDRALKLQEDLVETLRRVFGDGNPQTLVAQYRLATLLQRANRNDDAIVLHERVLPKLSQVLGQQNITTLEAMLQLAGCYLNSESKDRAVPLMREYFKAQSAQLGETSIQALQLRNRLAAMLLSAGQLAGAEEFARRAVADTTPAHTQTAAAFEATALLGEITVASGRDAEGELLLLDAIEKFEAAPPVDASARQRQRSAMLALITVYERTNRQHEASQLRTKLGPAKTLPNP